MHLNIPERITLIDLLPKEGHYADLVSLRKARDILSLTDDEVKDLDYKEVPNDSGGRTAYFDPIKASELVRDLPMDEWTTRTVENILSKMDKEGKLKEKYLSLYQKFVIEHER